MGLPMGAPQAMRFDPAVENSGSLTGHILAQGWTDVPEREERRTARVVLVMAIGLGVVVVVGILVALVVGNVFNSIFDGMIG